MGNFRDERPNGHIAVDPVKRRLFLLDALCVILRGPLRQFTGRWLFVQVRPIGQSSRRRQSRESPPALSVLSTV